MIRVTRDPLSIDLPPAHTWIAWTRWSSGVRWERFERACSYSLVFAALDGDEQVGFARVLVQSDGETMER